ncbi:general stress protein [Deinococcus pimensis]|uniref:general stress protein n=1 Tax=Deinococcus pimensis TaxID=309888 RepID=UPI0004B5AF9A|nr:general stress protein [Deinococcus pimensis]
MTDHPRHNDASNRPSSTRPGDNSVAAVYDSLAKAERAVRTLDAAGFPIRQVSIVARNFENEREVQGYVTTGDVARDGAVSGAWTGGIFGLLLGSAFLWVPAFGPLVVLGALATTLVGGIGGAAVGAATGGVLGALAGLGISRQHIVKYERAVQAGQFLLIAHGDALSVQDAYRVLEGTHAAELTLHADVTV